MNIMKQMRTCLIFAPIERQVRRNVEKVFNFYLFRSHENRTKNWIKNTTKYPMDWIFFFYTYYYKFHWLFDCDCYVRNEHWNELCRNSKCDRFTMTKNADCFLIEKSLNCWNVWCQNVEYEENTHGIVCAFFAVVERFEAVVRLFYIFVTDRLLLFYFNFIAPNVCDWIMNKIYIFRLSRLFSKSVSIYFHTHLFC